MTKRKPAFQRKTGKSILANFLRNLKENNLYYENLQITQCVFLGELKLKPVPTIFQTTIKTEPFVPKIKIEMKIKRNNDVKLVDKADVKKTTNKKSVANAVVTPGKVTKKNATKIKETVRKGDKKKDVIKIKLSPKKKQDKGKVGVSANKQQKTKPPVLPQIVPIKKQTYKIINSPKKLLSVIKEGSPPKKESLKPNKSPGKSPKKQITKKPAAKKLSNNNNPKNAVSPGKSKPVAKKPISPPKPSRKTKSNDKTDEATPSKLKKPNTVADKSKKPKKTNKSKNDIIEISDDENDANKTNVSASKKQMKKSDTEEDKRELVYVGPEARPVKMRQKTLDKFLKISAAFREMVEETVKHINVIPEDKPAKRTSPRVKMEKPEESAVVVEDNPAPVRRSLRSGGEAPKKTPVRRTLKPPSKKKTEEVLDITNDDDDEPVQCVYQNPATIVQQIAKITGCRDQSTSKELINELVLEIPNNKVSEVKRSPRLLRSNANETIETIDVDAPTKKRPAKRTPKEKSKVIVLDGADETTPDVEIVDDNVQPQNANTKVARVKPMMLLTETQSPAKDLYEFDDSEMEEVAVLRTPSPKKQSPKTTKPVRSSPRQLFQENQPRTRRSATNNNSNNSNSSNKKPTPTSKRKSGAEKNEQEKGKTQKGANQKTRSPPKNSQQRSIKDMFLMTKLNQQKQAEIDAVFSRPAAPSQKSPNENERRDEQQAKSDNAGKQPLTEVGCNFLNRDDDEDFDDDDDDDTRSHLEWMPDDYAQYKFQYSAKKINTYRPEHKCKVCLATFASYYSLNKHKSQHAKNENPYECPNCMESFRDVDTFNAHMRMHKGKEPFSCKKCHRGFQTKDELEEHETVHVLKKGKPAAKRFRCDVCAREFGKMSDMERHIRVHTGEKPSQCNICHKRFQHSYNLSKHLITHLHVKPFQCDICNKQFGRHDVLNRHLLIHSIEKPHKCQHCNKGFIRAGQLNKHVTHCQKLTKQKETNNDNNDDVNEISVVEA